MALRSNSTILRSMVSHFTRKTTFATSTTPRMKPQGAAAADYAHHPKTEAAPLKGQFVPVYVAIGMIILQVGFGLFTVFHQLRRAPNVFIKKSKRGTVVEVVEPEHVTELSDKFLKESFFRKIAHVQEFNNKDVVPDSIRGDVFAQHPRAVTLKDVGVDPVKDSGIEARPPTPRH